MKINQNCNTSQARQGDVWIEKVEAVPVGASKVERKPRGYVLAEGEATGHAHVITEEVDLYERDGVLYLNVPPSGATVVHEEHAAMPLSTGIYRVVRKREWTDDDERTVQD